MKDQIFSNINDFLTRAVDIIYKPMGMSVLYVPWEGTRTKPTKETLEMERESNIRMKHLKDQRSLIDRLEKVTRHWIRQIRESLIIIPHSEDKLYDVTSEFVFWKERCAYVYYACNYSWRFMPSADNICSVLF